MPVAKIVPKRAGSTPTSPAAGHRLGRGGRGELLDTVGAASLLGVVVPRRGIPVGEAHRAPRRDAGTEQAVPERVGADAAGRDDTETGDSDATPSTVHQPSLPAIRSYA